MYNLLLINKFLVVIQLCPTVPSWVVYELLFKFILTNFWPGLLLPLEEKYIMLFTGSITASLPLLSIDPLTEKSNTGWKFKFVTSQTLCEFAVSGVSSSQLINKEKKTKHHLIFLNHKYESFHASK